jgi:hypothetical protein
MPGPRPPRGAPKAKRGVAATQPEELLGRLRIRFDNHKNRHPGVVWSDVQSLLESDAEKLRSVRQMEDTGGEPDVVVLDARRPALAFVDCSPESPSGRRSLCYDGAARTARKEHKPRGSALEMAVEMGVELLSEAQYRALQDLGDFDMTTSSWVATPPEIRERGGALFCDRRYGHVFTYHNGAESYYAARGFRAILRL